MPYNRLSATAAAQHTYYVAFSVVLGFLGTKIQLADVTASAFFGIFSRIAWVTITSVRTFALIPIDSLGFLVWANSESDASIRVDTRMVHQFLAVQQIDSGSSEACTNI
jgi:hypothetical protein